MSTQIAYIQIVSAQLGSIRTANSLYTRHTTIGMCNTKLQIRQIPWMHIYIYSLLLCGFTMCGFTLQYIANTYRGYMQSDTETQIRLNMKRKFDLKIPLNLNCFFHSCIDFFIGKCDKNTKTTASKGISLMSCVLFGEYVARAFGERHLMVEYGSES